jgi:indole-3-glycerol phosphate synthase/phosphoribosylanthranilate isomerase
MTRKLKGFSRAGRRICGWRLWWKCMTNRELDRALASGAEIIGINNRDLRDFSVSLATTEKLAATIETRDVR